MHVEYVDEKEIRKTAMSNVASRCVRVTIVAKKRQQYIPF
jgi:hypothetical protein